MYFIKHIPALAYLFLIQNFFLFFGEKLKIGGLQTEILAFTLPSQMNISLTIGSLLPLVGMLLLYIEICKATREPRFTVIDHFLSLGVFIGLLLEFLLVKEAAHTSFLLLTGLAFLDVIAGFTISIMLSQSGIHLRPQREL